MPLRDSRRAAKATVRVVFLLSAVLTLVFLISFVFSEEGISELQRARKQVDDLRAEITQLETENARLRKEIDSLKRSTFVVERIAREDLGMSKPGEVVYMLPQDATAQP
jgi:cell division protein FtsL